MKINNHIIHFTILLVITLSSSCKETHKQIDLSQGNSIAQTDSITSDTNQHSTHHLTITEIPEFALVSTIESSTYDEASDTYLRNCGDQEYWSIIKMGESAIPFLISKLKSTTKTTISIPCEESTITEGGLAFILIDNIIGIPCFSIFQIQFDSFEMGCDYPSYLLNYMMGNPERTHEKISNWYDQNKKQIREVKLLDIDKTDCQKEFNINTNFLISD